MVREAEEGDSGLQKPRKSYVPLISIAMGGALLLQGFTITGLTITSIRAGLAFVVFGIAMLYCLN